MACGATLAKYLVFIFNLLFCIAGILLIVIGSLALTQKVDYSDVVKDAPDYKAVAVLFIVVGVIVTIIAFFGCCGAIQENVCMLNTFAVLLILIIIAEIAIAIAALVFRKELGGEIKKGMMKTLVAYNESNNETAFMWNEMQKNWECCGVESPNDWKENDKYKLSGTVPASCCNGTTTPGTDCTADKAFKNGCFNNMDSAMNKMYLAIGIVGIVVGLIEILGIVLACCLAKAVK